MSENNMLAAMRPRRQISPSSMAPVAAGRSCIRTALARYRAALGEQGDALIEDVLGRGTSVTALAALGI